MHGSQHFIEGNGSETGGVIGHAIGNDQFAVVEESATGINRNSRFQLCVCTPIASLFQAQIAMAGLGAAPDAEASVFNLRMGSSPVVVDIRGAFS